MNTNGFDPDIWGPGLWKALHLMAATYPPRPSAADRYNFKTFFSSLRYVLPCGGCREGYADIISSGRLKLTDAVMDSRRSLFDWLVGVHRAVDVKLGKPIARVTNDEWYDMYDSLR
jgi:hypothetical protein